MPASAKAKMPAPAVSYRAAGPKDAPALLELVLEGLEESAFATINPLKVFRHVVLTLETGIAYVAEVDGDLVGSVGIMPVAEGLWYSDDVFLMDSWMYVRPEFRAYGIFPALVDKMQQFRERAGGPPLAVGVLSKKDAALKSRLYRRHFTPVGEVFAVGFAGLDEPGEEK